MSVPITYEFYDVHSSTKYRIAHVAVSTFVGVFLCVATLSGFSLPIFWQAVLLGLLVAVIGIPHGGLDHKYGRAVCRPWVGRWWVAVFLSAYLSVGLMVLGGWLLAPLWMISIFFFASAVHFGERGLSLAGVIEGGMVIYLPFLGRPEEACRLLGWVIPLELEQPMLARISHVEPILWALAALLAMTIGRLIWVGVRYRNLDSTIDAVRLISFSAAFTMLPVLVSFIAFFCGWHSVRELGRLAREANSAAPGWGLWRVLKEAAPLGVVTVVGIALAAISGLLAGRLPEPVVVQAVFLGLSMVAIPHIALHALADRMGARAFEPGVK
jgi:Brp/Blh family beta-carotene 15,15'-monooxygenase